MRIPKLFVGGVKRIFIKDSREYEIDLDKVKSKYEVVKGLALKFEANRKRIAELREENKSLITKLRDGLTEEDIGIVGFGDGFSVKIYNLRKKEVKKVVKFVKTLKG